MSTISVFKTVKGVTPIRVGRRIFVSGLYWEVLPNGANYQDEARRIVKRERERTGVTMDVVYLRRHVDVVQAGFVVRGGRARKGTVSLAAVAIDALGPTFIAAFPLPDGRFALVSGSNNAIVPDSEGVYEAADARQRIAELWSALEATVGNGVLPVYAPTDLWPDGRPISLDELLPKTRRLHRLRHRPTLTGRGAITWIVSAAVASLLAAGWWGWQAYQADLARKEASRLAREAARLRDNSRPVGVDISQMRPWTHQPDLHQFAATCSQVIGEYPVTLDGWLLLKATCSGQSVSATYARTEGRTVLDFRGASLSWDPKAHIRFSSDGDLGMIDRAITMAASGDDVLAPIDARTHEFMTYWQKRFQPFELRSVSSSLASGYRHPAGADPASARPHWRTMTWAISSTPRNPVALLADLRADGLRLHEVTVNFNTDGKLQWSLKGELYGE